MSWITILLQPPWESKATAKIYSRIIGMIFLRRRKNSLRKSRISKAKISWILCYSKDVTGSSSIEGPLVKFPIIWRNFIPEMSLSSPRTSMTCKGWKVKRIKKRKSLRTPRVKERKKKSAMTKKKVAKKNLRSDLQKWFRNLTSFMRITIEIGRLAMRVTIENRHTTE